MASEVAPPSSAVIRKAPKPPKPKVKMGRKPRPVVCDRCGQTFASAGEVRGHECSNPKPMGRPRKPPAVSDKADTKADTTTDLSGNLSGNLSGLSDTVAEPPHASKGYSRIFVGPDGTDLAVPLIEETEVRRHAPAPAPVAPSVELAIPTDGDQKALIDEFGELNRQVQLHAPVVARFELLKRTLKGWLDGAPNDADAVLEGQLYRLHMSARERERHVRSVQEVADRIGLERLFQIITVPVVALQAILGSTEVDSLLVEKRSGSRRIRCIPKYAPTAPPN